VKVSAIIVTRGDVDLTPVVEPLPYDEVIIWDNSKRPRDLKTFGRYAAMWEARNDIIYVQDDDCIVCDHVPLLEQYQEGGITAFMKPERMAEYTTHALLGWGSIFHRRLPWYAFNRYLTRWPYDDFFLEVACDIVFGVVTPCNPIVAQVEDLPHATRPGRTSITPQWAEQKREATARALALAP
jgi:hypothetical protein